MKEDTLDTKWELAITDTLKLQQQDKYNIVIMELSEGKNVRTGEMVSSWKVMGYYTTVKEALVDIVRKDLLVDLRKVSTLKEYHKETVKQIEMIKELLNMDL